MIRAQGYKYRPARTPSPSPSERGEGRDGGPLPGEGRGQASPATTRQALDDTHIAAAIAGRRKSLGITQQVLAERIGVTFQQVQKYETGANRVAASRLVAIARALDTPPAWFLPPAPGDGPLPPIELDRARRAATLIRAALASALTDAVCLKAALDATRREPGDE